MTPTEHIALASIWCAWFLLWWGWAYRTKKVERGETVTSELAHQLPLAIALLMLWPWRLPYGLLNTPALPPFGWTGVVLTLAGVAFMIWARASIGANWSGRVTIKRDHALIDRGPYAFVRHPIYTGLLAAYLFTGLTWGDWRGLIAPLIAAVALWRKLRLEERFLCEQFGADYEGYRGRTRALIPFVL